MPHSRDLLARAYATLGLPPGSSRREVARKHRRLVKRWHPDQYAKDPQGQAEAAQRMREINRAFALVKEAQNQQANPGLNRAAPREERSDAPSRPRERYFGQRLSESDLNEIVDSIGRPNYFGTLMRYLFWAGSLPLGISLMVMAPRGQTPRRANVLAGMLLLVAAAVHLVRTMWLKRR